MPLSFPVRGILWEWIAVSPLAGSGCVDSRSLISEMDSFEWGTSPVTVTPGRSVAAAFSIVPMHRLQQPGAADRESRRLPRQIPRKTFRREGFNWRDSPDNFPLNYDAFSM